MKRIELTTSAKDAVCTAAHWRCEWCDTSGWAHDVELGARLILQVDHIVRVIDGGTNDPANLQALCVECHAIKTAYENRRDGRLRRGARSRFHRTMVGA